MVVKDEYLTLATHQKKKDGYVYHDYGPGFVVHHLYHHHPFFWGHHSNSD